MDMSMFTGFEGRINRAKWWLGAIILLIVGVIIAMILTAFSALRCWRQPSRLTGRSPMT